MNRFERKRRILHSLLAGEKVVILDEAKEYEQMATTLGVKIVKLEPNGDGVLDTFRNELETTV